MCGIQLHLDVVLNFERRATGNGRRAHSGTSRKTNPEYPALKDQWPDKNDLKSARQFCNEAKIKSHQATWNISTPPEMIHSFFNLSVVAKGNEFDIVVGFLFTRMFLRWSITLTEIHYIARETFHWIHISCTIVDNISSVVKENRADRERLHPHNLVTTTSKNKKN